MTHAHAEAERNIRNAVAEMHSIENEGGNEIKNNEEEKQQMSSSRVQNAVRLFESGYNCAQSVFCSLRRFIWHGHADCVEDVECYGSRSRTNEGSLRRGLIDGDAGRIERR